MFELNEDYISQVPMYYNYKIKNILIKDSHFIGNINEYDNISDLICGGKLSIGLLNLLFLLVIENDFFEFLS